MTASAFDVGSMKCACLLKRSTTAIMASMPVLATGKCVMKSMLTDSYGRAGTGNGCSRPIGLSFIALFLWHLSHDFTYFSTSLYILGQYTCPCIARYVLSILRCPAASWWSCNSW
jgi:hypothetical protein